MLASYAVKSLKLLLLAYALSFVAVACDRRGAEEGDLPPMANSGITTLQKNDLTGGSGPEARKGMTVVVHYTGWLYDPSAPENKGKKFDSSHDRNAPYEFPLGEGVVITGWDEGVAGMKVGGHRRLVIPPAMGYGAQGAVGAIPPNATLIFDVELVGVR